MESSTFNNINGNSKTVYIAEFIEKTIAASEGELTINDFFISVFFWQDHTIYVYSKNKDKKEELNTFDEKDFSRTLQVNQETVLLD